MLGAHYYRLSHSPTLSVVAPPPMVGAGNLIGEINGVEIYPIALVDVLITPALRGDQGTIVMGGYQQTRAATWYVTMPSSRADSVLQSFQIF